MALEQVAPARLAELGSLRLELVWRFFLTLSLALPIGSAWTDVSRGTITSDVAANVKSQVDLLMRISLVP
jgi:hypothetical protein